MPGGPLQLCKASVEAVEILDDCLPCCQAVGKGDLSENLLQNQIGETLNIYVFECGIVEACSARKHLESSHIILCRSARCHFELVKLCASHPCPIRVSKNIFDTFQKDVQCLHLRCPSYNCHGLSFTAQTCAVPLQMNESAYRIFILLSAKVSACIVTAI